MDPITIPLIMILGKVASSLFDYGLGVGWSKIFNSESDAYKKKLEDILTQTVSEFERTHYRAVEEGRFPFYHSQILLDSILRLRLFKNEPQQEIIDKIKDELKTNNNIQQPSEEELALFHQILIRNLNNDDEFRKIEINTLYKEVIFETYDQVKILRDELKSINIDEIGLLKQEYEAQVDEIYEEIKLLRFSTGLKKLKKLENRIRSNTKASNKSILSKVEFVKAICHDHIDENDLAKECYIKAYLLNPDDLKNYEIACWVYFKQKDNTYKALLEKLELIDPFNPYAWAIKTINADKIAEHIQQTPKFIQDNFRYKRNIFNYLISRESHKLTQIEFLFDDIHYDIPDNVKYDHLNDLIFLANLYFSRFVNTARIDFVRPTEITDQSKYLYTILEKLYKIKNQSEFGPSYNQLSLAYIWLKSEIYFDQVRAEDLVEVAKEVNKLDKIHALLIANSLQKRGDLKNALELIDKYEEDERSLSLKLFCLTDIETAKKVAEKYLDKIKGVDNYNVANVCAFLESIVKRKVYPRDEILSIIHSKEYSNEHFRELLILLAETYSEEDEVKLDKILALKESLAEHDYLNIFIAILLHDNKYYHECTEFVLPQINDVEKPHPGVLKLLIHSINNLRTEHQDKLPKLLRTWRENFEPNPQFLSMEVELYTHLQQWDKIKETNEFALNALPENEYFFTSYVDSLVHTKDYKTLSSIADGIVNFNFEYLDNAIYISDLLIRNDHPKEGFNLLYRYANDRTNIKARWRFFQLSTEFQDSSIFQEYEIVQPDSFVRLQANGTPQTKYIPKEKSNDDFIQSVLNKKKGDSFSITRKLTGKIVYITIERIVNKYLNVLSEIHEEFQNPASDYPVELIHLESNDITSFENELIRNFGVKNDLNRVQRERSLEDYWQYGLSFSETTIGCFDNDQISAYYSLISKDSKGFMVPPIKPSLGQVEVQYTKFVLDFTSGLLLFELSKSSNIPFKQNFIIAQSLINHIDSLIYKTKTHTSSLSLEVRGNSVIPHFKPEDFTENRIKFLTDIKTWFIENHTVELPQEKINFSRQLCKDDRNVEDVDILLETSLLGNRLNHVLVSDDVAYSKFFKMSDRQIPTDHFLTTYYSNYKKEIFNHLIRNRYIGVNFSSDDLYDCYIEQHKGEKSHIYEFCLRNLEVFYPHNPTVCNSIILDFLKQIATNPVYTEQTFEFEARNIFTRCLALSLSNDILADLALKASQMFKLLPTYFDALKRGMDDSLEIVN